MRVCCGATRFSLVEDIMNRKICRFVVCSRAVNNHRRYKLSRLEESLKSSKLLIARALKTAFQTIHVPVELEVLYSKYLLRRATVSRNVKRYWYCTKHINNKRQSTVFSMFNVHFYLHTLVMCILIGSGG